MRRLLLLGVVFLTACSGPSLLVVGESVRSASSVPLLQILVLDETGRPIPDALVSYSGDETSTDDDGVALGEWEYDPISVVAQAPGFHPATLDVPELPPDRTLSVALQPVVVTGRVLSADGRSLPGTPVRLGQLSTVTGPTGSYRFERALPGEVEVRRPAWQPATVAWDGQQPTVDVTLEPLMVKALQIQGPTPQITERWLNLLRIAENSEINALVIDIKDESGRVFHNSEVGLASEVGAVQNMYELGDVLAAVEDRGLYTIGRVVTFQDPFAARNRTELAILDTSTGQPFNKNNQWFLDPTDPAARRYAIDLGVEACRLGMDEIQFDYVRFPDGFGSNVRFDGGSQYIGAYNDPVSGAARVEAIAAFLAEAREEINAAGCAVGADIFAYVMRTSDDQGIGQRPEDLSRVVDVISPMVYPDHYSTGNFGFENPKDHPGSVVNAALGEGVPRIQGTAVLRPWLADYHYTPDQVRAEIEAAEGYGLGWMLWNGKQDNSHTEAALLPAEG